MEHSNANEAFAWAFLLRLNEGTEEVPPYLKQVLLQKREYFSAQGEGLYAMPSANKHAAEFRLETCLLRMLVTDRCKNTGKEDHDPAP